MTSPTRLWWRCARLAREREEEIRRKVAEELEQGGDEREEVET